MIRGFVIAGAMTTLALLSYCFMPPGAPDRREQRAAGLLARQTEDRSPLAGAAVNIAGVNVRRLEKVAVVTFSFDVFDANQQLLPAAKARLLQLAASLRRVDRKIALDIAGYAPEGTRAGSAYALGLSRAAGIAQCLVATSGIQPSCIAARSLGDSELHGDAERPHAVVITITGAEESGPLLATVGRSSL